MWAKFRNIDVRYRPVAERELFTIRRAYMKHNGLSVFIADYFQLFR